MHLTLVIAVILLYLQTVKANLVTLRVLDCQLDVYGQDYFFSRNKTVSGRSCQRWDVQTPHKHKYTDVTSFPDDTLRSAENYCRNPDDSETFYGPWCYTTDPGREWEYCDVTHCPIVISEAAEYCKFSRRGTEYSGSESRTRSGRLCQSWDSQYPHRHWDLNINFSSVRPRENYCRNPTGRPDGPWCYTMDYKTRWEYCDVPSCSRELWEAVLQKSGVLSPSNGRPEVKILEAARDNGVKRSLYDKRAKAWLGVPTADRQGGRN